MHTALYHNKLYCLKGMFPQGNIMYYGILAHFIEHKQRPYNNSLAQKNGQTINFMSSDKNKTCDAIQHVTYPNPRLKFTTSLSKCSFILVLIQFQYIPIQLFNVVHTG